MAEHSHSPEPWFAVPQPGEEETKEDIHYGTPEFSDFNGDVSEPMCVSPIVVAHKIDLKAEDARRIVACVNFLKGFSTEWLESHEIAAMVVGDRLIEQTKYVFPPMMVPVLPKRNPIAPTGTNIADQPAS